MTTIIVSDRQIETGKNSRLVIVEPQEIRAKAEYCASFPYGSVAVTDPDLARDLGVSVYASGKIERADTTDFFQGAPEWLQKKHEKRVIDSASVTQDIRRIKVESLDDLDIAELSKAGGVYLVKVPTGHGKSKKIAGPAFADAVKAGRRTALVSPLISICSGFHSQAEEATGKKVAYYNSMSVDDADSFGIITTINSSIKKCVAAMTERSDVLVIEEAQKTIETIAESKDLAGQRRAIWNQMQTNVAKSHAVFALDADINDSAVNFFRSAGREPVLIEVEANYSDIAVELRDWGQNFGQIQAAARSGEKVSIAVDSKARAEKIAHALRDVPGLLLIHAENKGRDQQKAFLESPNDNLDGVNVLIYTPVMASSVSVEKEHFDRHFACFSGVLTPMSCVQMLRRIRPARKFEVSVDAPKYIGWLETEGDFECDDAGINVIRERNRYLRESIATSFEITLKHLKFDVSEAAGEGPNGHADYQRASREHKEQYVEAVLSAELISTKEAKRLRMSDTMTAEKIARRDATLIFEMCGEVSKESIAFYAHGDGERTMRLHEILAMSETECVSADNAEKSLDDCDRIYYEATQKMLTTALRGLGTRYGASDAISVLAQLRKLKTWNKIKICNLPSKGRMTEKTAMLKAGAIMRALGYRTRTRKGVAHVTGVEHVERFVAHRLGRAQAKCIATDKSSLCMPAVLCARASGGCR